MNAEKHGLPSRLFRVGFDPELSDQWFLGLPVEMEKNPWAFISGRRAEVDGPLTIPVRVTGQPLEFSFGAYDLPVVTERVGTLIEGAALGEVQRVPVTVQGAEGPYEILNVLSPVDCIDRERTNGTMWRPEDGRPEKVGRYRAIYDLRLRAGVPRRIFRVAGWEVALIVAEELKSVLEGAGATKGLRFRQVI